MWAHLSCSPCRMALLQEDSAHTPRRVCEKTLPFKSGIGLLWCPVPSVLCAGQLCQPRSPVSSGGTAGPFLRCFTRSAHVPLPVGRLNCAPSESGWSQPCSAAAAARAPLLLPRQLCQLGTVQGSYPTPGTDPAAETGEIKSIAIGIPHCVFIFHNSTSPWGRRAPSCLLVWLCEHSTAQLVH